MEIFLESEEYQILKTKYEKQCFKVFDKYHKYDGDKISQKTGSDMNEYFKNKKVTIEYVEQTTKKGTTVSTTKGLSKNFYQIWSEDPDMREYDKIVFDCNLKKVPPTYFNLFNGFDHFKDLPDKEMDLSLIFDHIRSLVDYNEKHFVYVISYLAHLVQLPHILPHKTLIFISEEGVGKDIFARFMGEVISSKYSFNTEKIEQMCGKFNSVLGGKLMVIVNETNPQESRARIENIKFLITAPKIIIEGKYKDAIEVDNFIRFIFFSNRLFAFPLDGDANRRPVIFKSSSKNLIQNIGLEANQKYFTELVEQYENPDYQNAFLRYLKAYDISNFNPSDIEKSELHKELEDNSICPIVGFLASLVDCSHETELKISTVDCLRQCNEYMQEYNFKHSLTQSKFNVEMVSTYKIKKI